MDGNDADHGRIDHVEESKQEEQLDIRYNKKGMLKVNAFNSGESVGVGEGGSSRLVQS